MSELEALMKSSKAKSADSDTAKTKKTEDNNDYQMNLIIEVFWKNTKMF